MSIIYLMSFSEINKNWSLLFYEDSLWCDFTIGCSYSAFYFLFFVIVGLTLILFYCFLFFMWNQFSWTSRMRQGLGKLFKHHRVPTSLLKNIAPCFLGLTGCSLPPVQTETSFSLLFLFPLTFYFSTSTFPLVCGSVLGQSWEPLGAQVLLPAVPSYCGTDTTLSQRGNAFSSTCSSQMAPVLPSECRVYFGVLLLLGPSSTTLMLPSLF